MEGVIAGAAVALAGAAVAMAEAAEALAGAAGVGGTVAHDPTVIARTTAMMAARTEAK